MARSPSSSLIVGVGFLINSAIIDAAKANPGTNFAIVHQDGFDHGPNGDQYPGTAIANLKGLQFATNQSAFQAGYLAAGFSKTGTAATYGGLNIPPVTIFMDGFAKGVAYYNKVRGTKVVTLGWDTVKKDGLYVGGFSDQAKALQFTKNFEEQGADVIFPVAGRFTSAGYLGTLANGGTYLASYHDLTNQVPAALQKEVTQLGLDIQSGKVKVE